MSLPHRIRLQAAWRPAPDGGSWTRSFGRPAGVGPGDRVWLVIERPAASAAALNGRGLPAAVAGAPAWRQDVTAELVERNELRLDFATPQVAPAGDRVPLPEPLGVVALEIETR